ncbi:MAG: S46 family peptidase, partial [Phenylobacterium sp.]|uniref:S46 family peptidase n=1 Tax=Phenylobacterium sp. TaxID=1871053 RepID=UPI0027310E8F
QLESGAGSLSELFLFARELVRAGQERAKPSAERLPEYGDAGLALMAKQILDEQPVDAALEQLYLGFWLSKTREYLTVDDAAVKQLLGKESPEAMAARLVAGTKLADPAERKRLWDGGLPAILASTDPMIQLALRIDPAAREVRTAWETEVSGPTDRAAERIARARFAAYGDAVYPDATFTLRLSYGKVAGWTHRGVTIPPFTTFAGLYDRATGAEPFQLAPRWVAAKDRLNPATVYNFVTTNDIIGGNSGSPVLNAKAEILGAAFDGNIHSLGGNYGYDGTINRTVVVATSAATEALEKVYGQTALVKELTAK